MKFTISFSCLEKPTRSFKLWFESIEECESWTIENKKEDEDFYSIEQCQNPITIQKKLSRL